MKRFKNTSMKTKSENTNNSVPSNSITKAQAMAWFDATYRAQSNVSQDLALGMKALNFLENAAQQDADLDALCCLGLLYLTGSGVNMPNKDKGRAMLRLSAEGGNISAMYCLARFYEGNQEKDQKVVELYKKSANAGHPGAQYHLGLRCTQGRGVEEDEEMASKYFRKAAKQGHSGAQYYLGLRYEVGLGVEKNEDKALKYLRRAAYQGHKEARSRLIEKLGVAKTLFIPVRSARDGEEKPSMVAALLSPRGKIRASTMDEPLSSKGNRAKPGVVQEEPDPKMESARPSMMGGLLSPKRERKREERGKESTRMGVSPKKDPCKYHEDIPELRLSSSTSLKDSWQPIEGSARPNNSYDSVRRKPPRKSSSSGQKSNEGNTTSEESGKVSMWGWLSPRREHRKEEDIPALVLGSPTSLTSPCRTIEEGGSGLRDSHGPIRRESPRKSSFSDQKSNDSNTTSEESGKVSMWGWLSPRREPRKDEELIIGSPTSLTGPCRTAEGGGSGLNDSYGSRRRRESTPKSPFLGQKSNGDRTKEELSNSLQLKL